MVVICRGKMDVFLCFVGNNLSNKFNRSKTFNIEPSVRYQKPTLPEHVSTQQHCDAVAAEHLQRVSDFHKEVVDREKTADGVLLKVFIAICGLAQHEISNMKLRALLELFDVTGNNEIRNFFLPVKRNHKRYVPSHWTGYVGENSQETYRSEICWLVV